MIKKYILRKSKKIAVISLSLLSLVQMSQLQAQTQNNQMGASDKNNIPPPPAGPYQASRLQTRHNMHGNKLLQQKKMPTKQNYRPQNRQNISNRNVQQTKMVTPTSRFSPDAPWPTTQQMSGQNSSNSKNKNNTGTRPYRTQSHRENDNQTRQSVTNRGNYPPPSGYYPPPNYNNNHSRTMNLNQSGFNMPGFNTPSFNTSNNQPPGFNRNNYNNSGFNRPNFNSNGFNFPGFGQSNNQHQGRRGAPPVQHLPSQIPSQNNFSRDAGQQNTH